MTEPFVVRRETQIAASRATVFAYLTDPEKILSWMGSDATTEPHPGGLYLMRGIGPRGGVARGAFREVVPVHRLAYTFGWEGGQEVPPGSSLIEIDLIERDGGTLPRTRKGGRTIWDDSRPQPRAAIPARTRVYPTRCSDAAYTAAVATTCCKSCSRLACERWTFMVAAKRSRMPSSKAVTMVSWT